MPEHGTHARYCTKGCRCWPCRLAHYEYNTNRDKQLAYKRWQKFVPADPVREHVRSLMAAGVGWRRVAMAADVQATSVNRILYVKPLQQRVRTDIAEKLLAVRPSLDLIGDTTAIDAVGTRRRLQALIANGWSQVKLGKKLGVHATNVGRMLYSPRVMASSARLIRSVYEDLWDVNPPEADWRDKIAANRARGYAAERGWVRPMAWDDGAIDDPTAVPVGAGFSSRAGKLPDADEIDWLIKGGDSIEVIAAHYDAKVDAVRRKLQRAEAKA